VGQFYPALSVLPGTIFYAFLGASAGVLWTAFSWRQLNHRNAVQRENFLISSIGSGIALQEGIKS
jgi:hypothetical protein